VCSGDEGVYRGELGLYSGDVGLYTGLVGVIIICGEYLAEEGVY